MVFAYNTSVHASTGITPYEAMFGRAPRLPIDLVFPVPECGGRGTHHQYIEDKLAHQQDVYQRMREVQRCVVRRTARNYNPRGAQRLEVGS